MITRKVKLVWRNKWGEMNKMVTEVEMPNTIVITPIVDGKRRDQRRVNVENIAEMDFMDNDQELTKFKKQYKKD